MKMIYKLTKNDGSVELIGTSSLVALASKDRGPEDEIPCVNEAIDLIELAGTSVTEIEQRFYWNDPAGETSAPCVITSYPSIETYIGDYGDEEDISQYEPDALFHIYTDDGRMAEVHNGELMPYDIYIDKLIKEATEEFDVILTPIGASVLIEQSESNFLDDEDVEEDDFYYEEPLTNAYVTLASGEELCADAYARVKDSIDNLRATIAVHLNM